MNIRIGTTMIIASNANFTVSQKVVDFFGSDVGIREPLLEDD